MSLEIHHIIPEQHDGPNSEENGAPLCASCHRSFGGNPDHRARIRVMRDHWYEACEGLFGLDSPSDVFDRIHKDFSTEDLERLAIHNSSYLVRSETSPGLDTTRFSFHREEYVHPLIVRKLLGRISDSGATIVGVDIETANRSNRFYGDFAIVDDPDGMKVSWDDVDRTFVYRHVATTPSGIDIVECHDWLGGSGVFSTVALFNLEHDRALESDGKILSSRVRPVLKIQGQFGLGDRYRGNVSYRTGVLKVGPDEGWFRRGEAAAWRLPVL